MSNCADIQFISQDEFIGDSLPKINNNFKLLEEAACNLKQQYEGYRNIRTFFYYGPNAPTESETGTYDENNELKYPSTSTIVNFVSGSDGLNLLPISKKDDVVWVIYQKTGWATQTLNRNATGTDNVKYTAYSDVPITRVIGIGGKRGRYTVTIGWTKQAYTATKPWSWNENFTDTHREYAPIFVIYKLIHNGTNYVIDNTPDGRPKFVRAQTGSTINWNRPQLWNTY